MHIPSSGYVPALLIPGESFWICLGCRSIHSNPPAFDFPCRKCGKKPSEIPFPKGPYYKHIEFPKEVTDEMQDL